MSKRMKLINKAKITFGVFAIVIGGIILSYDYFNRKINYAYDYMNMALLEETNDSSGTSDTNEQTNEVELTIDNNEIVEEPSSNPSPVYYIGTLEIPRINLNRGFVALGSSENHINKNITIINGSDYPDVKNGNFILASHSGNTSVAYFRQLYNLEKNDYTYVYYKNIKYTYKIVNIYLEDKDGKVAIYRNENVNTLTLITCTKNDDYHQTVYIAELEKKEEV